jgi:F-type H+-transporting ATPase subunit b
VPEELTLAELLAQADEAQGEEHEAEAHEEDDAVVNPVLPSGAEILWALIFFAALWAAMKYILLPPVQKTRAERAAKIAAAKDAVGGASADVADKQAAYDATIATARTEATSLFDAARVEIEAHRATVVGAAEAEVATLHESAAAELATARSAAVGSLRSDVSAVAVGAASTVLGSSVDAGSAQSVIDAVLDGGAA